MNNTYNKYKQQSIMTMTAGEMVVKLYDGIILQCNKAMIAIDNKNIVDANNALIRVQDILSYLTSTLDKKYEISNNLEGLYNFFKNQIIQANIKKDKQNIETIIPMVTELRDAYEQAEKIARQRR